MRRIVSGIILFILLVGMSTLVIQLAKSDPATITVPDDYPTIQEAINNANNGDTVFVRNGTYDENIVVNKSLSLIGEDRDTTIIDGGNRNRDIVVVEATNVIVSSFTIENTGVGLYHGISMHHSCNSSLVDNNLFYNTLAIRILDSPGSVISGNKVYYNDWGILVIRSSNTRISNNTVKWAVQYSYVEDGIAVGWSDAVSIFNNNVIGAWWSIYITGSTHAIYIFNNNVKGGKWGIEMQDVCGVSVFCNNFVDNWHTGIYINNSTRNLVHKNNLTGNGNGILLGNSSDNLIYHNNFVNNTNQVYEWIFPNWLPSINTWVCGYPGGGNYWSDYNGSDFYQGPFQNVTGNDGIGDDPYLVNENNTDNYPLMNPYTNANAHAIGVAGVSLSRSVLCQGLTTEISLDVVNYGRFTENINLTIYANTTILKQIELTLTSIDITTLTFTWNTTGFTKGNHTITVTASPVPGEIDTLDNNNTCWAIVSMTGDITGPDGWPDGKVDMRDLGLVASAFGSCPGHPRWNQIADINQDDKVDMRDIGTTAKHFGETDP